MALLIQDIFQFFFSSVHEQCIYYPDGQFHIQHSLGTFIIITAKAGLIPAAATPVASEFYSCLGNASGWKNIRMTENELTTSL